MAVELLKKNCFKERLTGIVLDILLLRTSITAITCFGQQSAVGTLLSRLFFFVFCLLGRQRKYQAHHNACSKAVLPGATVHLLRDACRVTPSSPSSLFLSVGLKDLESDTRWSYPYLHFGLEL